MKIEYDRVSFAYQSAFALNDISCELKSGNTALIVGHNGSGKSTFLKLMDGILKPTEGTIRIGDLDTRERRTSELASRCALSFQNPDDQLFAPTIRKELRFGIDNIKGDDSLFEPVVRMMHLENFLEANPYSLTYALRRLVAIGGSAAMNTPILALDEPTAGLSLREKTYLGNLLSLLRSRKKTLAIVTHDLNFLLPYADDLLMLSHGKIEYFGSRDALFGREDARAVMSRCGIKYPIYARMSAALDIEEPRFGAVELLDGLKKKRAGATQRTNGQHQLEGA